VTKLLVGFAFLGALALFAEGENVIQTDFPYANMTALTIVAVVLVFIVTKMLPDLHGKITQAIGEVAKQGAQQSSIFAATVKDLEQSFTAVLDKMHERSHEDQTALASALMTLAAQCARRDCESQKGT